MIFNRLLSTNDFKFKIMDWILVVTSVTTYDDLRIKVIIILVFNQDSWKIVYKY